MGLNIQSSTMGYDTVGLQDLIKNIKIDIIPAMASSIRNSKNDVRDTINSVWVGASANAFKDKLDRDTEVLCKTLMDLTEAVENDIKTAGVNVEELDAEIAKMFGGTGAVASIGGMGSSISIGGDSSTGSSSNSSGLLGNIKSFLYKAYPIEPAMNILKKTGATVATATFGLVEGLEMFGEAIVDTVAIVGTGVATLGTGAYDLITGSDTTKQMWDKTKGFVSTNYTKNTFDKFYENTGAGQWIQSNAVGFNIVRNVSSGIGYTAGIVAATVLTAGVAGVAVGAGAAGTSAVTVSAGQLALTAGVAGFGRGTQDAWADGAGTLQGLGYGLASGTWEAAQFYAGAKIGGFEAFSSTGANVAARIGMDTVDGALEGFVQPAMQMIYKDGSYKEMFEANGGWGNVAQQAAIGAVGSAIGEAGNLRSMLKTDSAASNIKVTPEKTLTAAGGVLLGGDLSKNIEVNTKSIDLNTKSVDLNTKSLDTNIKNVEVSAKPLDTNLKSTDINTSTPKVDTNIKTDTNVSNMKADTTVKTDTSTAVKADTPSVAKTDTSIKTDATTTAKVETAVKAESNVSSMKVDTTVKADTNAAVKADTTSSAKVETTVKAESNVSSMKADTTVKADTSAGVKADTTVKAESNVSNVKADTTVKTTVDATNIKTDANTSTLKPDVELFDSNGVKSGFDTKVTADVSSIKADVNTSGLKPDVELFDSNGVKSGLDTKVTADVSSIKTDVNTSGLKPDVELVGGSYKPSIDEATVKLSDTANLKPDVELVGGSKVDIDGPTVKLDADVNEKKINIFDSSSSSGLKPDVELFDSNGVKSGLDTKVTADANVSNLKADVELIGGNTTKPNFDTSVKSVVDTTKPGLKADVELIGGNTPKPSFDASTKPVVDTNVSNLKADVELIDSNNFKIDSSNMTGGSSLNTSLAGGSFASSSPAITLGGVETTGATGAVGVATTLANSTPIHVTVGNAISDANVKVNAFDSANVGSPVANSINSTTSTNVSGLKADVELIGGNTAKPSFDASVKPVVDTSKPGLKADVELIDTNPVKNGVTASVSSVTNGTQSKFVIPEFSNFNSQSKGVIDSVVESKLLDRSLYLGSENGKITGTYFSDRTAFSALYDSIEKNYTPGYKKYGTTNIPEQLVITNSKLNTIISNSNSKSVTDVLNNIAYDYGNDSIQVLTARGNALTDIFSTPDHISKIKEISSLDQFDKEYSALIGEHVNSIYKQLGLESKEYTSILANEGVNFKHAYECSAALDKYFKDDKAYWDSLSADQRESMEVWTGSGFDVMAGVMRSGREVGEYTMKCISQLSTQLDPNSSSGLKGMQERTILYRGLNHLNWVADGQLKDLSNSQIVETINNIGVGTVTIKDNAFASSTPVMSGGFTSKRFVEVTSVPKGTGGSWIGTNSSSDLECEYLLNAGSGNRKVILGAEEIGDQVFVYTQMVE